MELSKENQEWLEKHEVDEDIECFAKVYVVDLRPKILQDQQKIEELEKEVQTLKDCINYI